MGKIIMDFDDFWQLISSDTDFDDSITDITQQVERQKKLDAFYQHLENELDEKQKHKDKKAVKLDEPTKNYLDDLVANYELSKKKREYLTRQLKTTSTGPEGFTAQI
jgi:predicted RNase H-like nuclease (RuvC/YqgF family)